MRSQISPILVSKEQFIVWKVSKVQFRLKV